MEFDIFKKFSEGLRKTLIDAEKIAKEHNSDLNTEHQLLSLLNNKETLAYEILSGFEITADRIELINSLISHNPGVDKREAMSSDAKKSIQLAVQIASKYHHLTVGPEHLLLALVSAKSFNAYLIIERIGIDPKKMRRQIESIFKGISNSMNAIEQNTKPALPIENMLPEEGFDEVNFIGPQSGPFIQTPTDTKKDSALDNFSVNLTKEAKNNLLDPVVGRELETSRVIQTLSRRTKNNPILVGEPGVGKTSIVEGLAQRIISGNVPKILHNTEILSIDLGSILAGTMYRGQFESRIKKILSEIEKRGNVILFVDEIHMMVGAGSTEGSIDAANLLKPMLAKGKLRLIGSTTFEEYKKHIEKDAAFERRFQPIKVSEATEEETIKILDGIKGRYEKFHNIRYSQEAIVAAAQFAHRYIHDRFLPDKAIDLIDEVGASKNAKIIQPSKLFALKKELQNILSEKEALILSEKFEEAAKLREREIKVEDQIKILDKFESKQDLTITEEDIAKLVSEWTGVPVANMTKVEKNRYLNLSKQLRKYIVGQDEAIIELSKAIKRARVGISNQKRPIGSFIFLGPTGVGKTELTKVLAREIFGNDRALVKIDMSEFMEKHNVARLIGAPAGYIGYEDGGKLTEAVRKNPYSVILFDEIEKAHPEVFNILLQIMEDGDLTDAKGRKIDFRNTIIIMTSNLGTDILRRQSAIGFNKSNSEKEHYQKLRESVLETVEKSFRPEFINRLDQIIVFYPLQKESIKKIVSLQLEELKARLKAQSLGFEYSKDIISEIAEKSFNAEFGARPIRKFIADNIETLISDAILEEKYSAGDTIKVIIQDNKLTLE